jgi:GDP-L-fucose synthase
MRILVTGATGFLGRHLLPVLQGRYAQTKVIGVSTRDFDLLDPTAVRQMFQETRPQIVVHLAAYSGGIGANVERPADFYYRNTLLTALVFEEAARSKVRKLVYTMGGCSYPATARSPIAEEQMWEGYPQKESAAYSTAKKMGIIASQAYRKQHGLNSIVLIPGNIYGEFDNFRTGESHVIPALMLRLYEASMKGTPSVVMWGSGAPQRDFAYAGDVARLFPYFIDHYDSSEPVNVSTGTSTSIKELAETLKEVVGYSGELCWDRSKPDGQMVKIFDVGRLRSLGLSCPTTLADGLWRTFDWLRENYRSRGDGIRLDKLAGPRETAA